jgi:hypothetical protein
MIIHFDSDCSTAETPETGDQAGGWMLAGTLLVTRQKNSPPVLGRRRV